MAGMRTLGPRSRDLRQISRFAILREIYAHGTPSRRELSGETGLSFATVATIVTELINVGMLVEAGREESAGGRPLSRLRISPQRGILIGVDVAETYIDVDFFDSALSRLARHREEIGEQSEPAVVVSAIAEAIRRGIAEHGSGRDVLGVGVSLPGPVSPGGVTVADPTWRWRNLPVQSMLAGELSLPIHTDNPLKAITLAELWFGAERSAESMIAVYLGTGVGCGIALGGQLIRGRTNNAGEWGHTTLMMDGRRCRCGRRGCVEAYVGVPGLMETMRARRPDHPYLGDGQLRFVERFRRGLAEDDPDAQWLLAQFTHQLGAGLANLVDLVNPEVMVLGGWLVEQLGSALLEPTRQRMAAESIAGAAAAVRLVTTSLIDPVGLGMATLALEHFLEELGLPSRGLGAELGSRAVARPVPSR